MFVSILKFISGDTLKIVCCEINHLFICSPELTDFSEISCFLVEAINPEELFETKSKRYPLDGFICFLIAFFPTQAIDRIFRT